MPSYCRLEGLHRVAKSFADKPTLSAEQIEDVAAYLMDRSRGMKREGGGVCPCD